MFACWGWCPTPRPSVWGCCWNLRRRFPPLPGSSPPNTLQTTTQRGARFVRRVQGKDGADASLGVGPGCRGAIGVRKRLPEGGGVHPIVFNLSRRRGGVARCGKGRGDEQEELRASRQGGHMRVTTVSSQLRRPLSLQRPETQSKPPPSASCPPASTQRTRVLPAATATPPSGVTVTRGYVCTGHAALSCACMSFLSAENCL